MPGGWRRDKGEDCLGDGARRLLATRACGWMELPLLGRLRSLLIRYGFHAYGNPADHNGLVVFAGDRVRLVEVVAEVVPESLPAALQEDWPDSVTSPEELRRLAPVHEAEPRDHGQA